MDTLKLNIDNWVILSVCSTCEYAVDGGGEINNVSDARSAEALEVHWQGYHLWGDCSGDDCESEHAWMCVLEGCDDPEDEDAAFGFTHEYGHHDGGFTWSPCDICGQGGRASHRVIAHELDEPPTVRAEHLAHEVTAGDLCRGDTILAAEGVEGLPLMVESLDFSPHSVYAKLNDPVRFGPPDYRWFHRDEPVTILFGSTC